VSGPARSSRRGEAGQALIETALVVPLLLLLAVGVVGGGRVVQGQLGVSAVAREAARAAAMANTAGEARARGLGRGQDVAAGYRLGNGSLALAVDPGDFARGGQIRAEARYDVTFDDLPLLNWARLTLTSRHLERIDAWRSRWSEGP